jgi:predicted metal-binding protein
MAKDIIEKYIKLAIKKGATEAKVIHPSSVVTAPWVRMKCQFGCPAYGKSYCCPPDTSDHHQTREMMESYQRAILFRIEAADSANRNKNLRKVYKSLVDIEGQLFKDGMYKAFLYISGPCSLCKECEKMNDEPCQFGFQARPSMEACAIDVYQTARNAGLFIETLSETTETQNRYCLLMVD